MFFFFNDTATTEIYTLSLHDALPIWLPRTPLPHRPGSGWLATGGTLHRVQVARRKAAAADHRPVIPQSRSSAEPISWLRSEEHTSELQSRQYLVCRLLLEKKNTTRLL